ncbi:MAG: (d)CMP kinase, partial [Ruminococcus sp.]|nr:(d)CMP kinase [Candidatus Copronaster equi]
MAINVAIDGPAGAGKSSVSKLVAKKLGFIYVDTGALYRTVGLYSIRKGYDTKDADKVISTLPDINVNLKFIDDSQHVFLNGEDVSQAIRTPEASMGASNVSAIPKVREFLFDLQRNIAKENNCLMDGRDIGTVVLP